MQSDKMDKAKKYLQMAMDCLSGGHEEEVSEEDSSDDSEESSSSDDDMDSSRAMLKQRLGKYK